jgi:hypothetical protein
MKRYQEAHSGLHREVVAKGGVVRNARRLTSQGAASGNLPAGAVERVNVSASCNDGMARRDSRERPA